MPAIGGRGRAGWEKKGGRVGPKETPTFGGSGVVQDLPQLLEAWGRSFSRLVRSVGESFLETFVGCKLHLSPQNEYPAKVASSWGVWEVWGTSAPQGVSKKAHLVIAWP